MLDSHLGVPDAVPEADAWRTGSYLASMDRALLLFDFDPAGSVLSTNANFLAAMGYASDEALTLRHDMLCDSMDEGKGIASAEQIWARLRRGEHFSGTCRYRRRNGGAVIEATYLPQINPAGEVERISVVSRKSIADAERQEEVRLLLLGINETGNAVAVSGPTSSTSTRAFTACSASAAPTRSIRSWANCWPAAGRMAARAKSWIAASPAARATTRTCWSTIAPASRYGCLSWPTPCSTSAARWSTWWMC